MRHALADQERGGGYGNEKRKGKIEKVLKVYLICVCAHFYTVILYLYNF